MRKFYLYYADERVRVGEKKEVYRKRNERVAKKKMLKSKVLYITFIYIF